MIFLRNERIARVLAKERVIFDALPLDGLERDRAGIGNGRDFRKPCVRVGLRHPQH
jgi:hypothetical protein